MAGQNQVGSYCERKAIKKTIVQYIARQNIVSRNDIMQECGYSLPTVLQKVKELVESGLVAEIGQSEWSGGRRAKLLAIVGGARYAAGINITRNHMEMVLIGLDGKIVAQERIRLKFAPDHAYYQIFGEKAEQFITQNISETDRDKLLGVSVSIPGVLDHQKKMLVRSHVLMVTNYSLKDLGDTLDCAVIFDNDANCAAYSEAKFRSSTAFYLSLNYTVGGAFSINGSVFEGSHNKSSEVGHMTFIPGGKPCYCGKNGCVDSYCSARLLAEGNLQEFFAELSAGKREAAECWDQYLRDLSTVIVNLRVLYDCDIIVGGYVGGYIEPYMPRLGRLVMENDKFDADASFLSCGTHKWEASAYGAALRLVDNFFSTIC